MLRRLLGALVGKGSAPEKRDTEQPAHLAGLTWLDPEENPFGIRVLDCRCFTKNMLSTTPDTELAQRFLHLRNSTGEEYRGQVPGNLMAVSCRLVYAHEGSQGDDGPLFKAEEMEDKWDVYFYDGYLYFCRSWGGELVFRAKVEFSASEAIVTHIDADSKFVFGEEALALRQVDFLIKSHLHHLDVPHPLPAGIGDCPEEIAQHSFSAFGRWASYATREDTVPAGR